MIDIAESSLSQEEVDEENARLLESPPAAEAQATQPEQTASKGEAASPSAAVREGTLIALTSRCRSRYRQLIHITSKPDHDVFDVFFQPCLIKRNSNIYLNGCPI